MPITQMAVKSLVSNDFKEQFRHLCHDVVGKSLSDFVQDISRDLPQITYESFPRDIIIDVRTKSELDVGIPDIKKYGLNNFLVAEINNENIKNFGDICERSIIECFSRDIFQESRKNSGLSSDYINFLKNTTIIAFICRSGVRSNTAAEIMHKRGWIMTNNIIGGIYGVDGWVESGLALCKYL